MEIIFKILIISVISYISISCLDLLLEMSDKHKKIKLENSKVKLKEYEINMNIKYSGAEALAELDALISDNFNMYLMSNIEYVGADYINQEMQEKLLREVSVRIAKNISPVLIQKLSLIYNVNSISDMIAERLNVEVVNYTVNKNKGIGDK